MIDKKLKEFIPVIEDKLKSCLSHKKTEFDSVYNAMEYSLLLGGKRLRPFILNEFYKLSGGKGNSALDFCAALEMIHTYSLIHDDLPCMDNDDFRRGKPSCHKKYGEDIALLAGDGLLTLAFNIALRTENIPESNILKGMKILSECAGSNGMIGGQVIDLECEKRKVSAETILEMHTKKTSALLVAGAVIGTVLGGGDEKHIAAAEDYAVNLGIAFQIKDDILDLVGDEKLLGKPVGSDSKNNKFTYISLVGFEKAEADVKIYTNKAINALDAFGTGSEVLKELALYLVNRNY